MEDNKINEELLENVNLDNEKDLVSEEMDGLKLEIDKINDKYLRLNAEYMNYKKRTEKEKQDIYKYANEKLIVDLLPVLDSFDRAIVTMIVSDENKGLIDGINLIKKNLEDFLNKNNVISIETENMKFDPEFHNAVMTECDESKEDDEIIQEFQKGYKIDTKVIRHSMVKVNKR
jgi:molecular chaperone GrpE